VEKEIYNALWNNRMLKDANEINRFEESLCKLADSFCEEDIQELCLVLDDKTRNSEVMFSIIHLLETLSSEQAFRNTMIGVVNMRSTSPEWANIILYRCLNDEFSVCVLKKIFVNLDNKTRLELTEMLKDIKNEDEERFSDAVSEIID